MMWLGFQITDMVTVNAPSVCYFYLYQGQNVANIWGFKALQASGASKE